MLGDVDQDKLGVEDLNLIIRQNDGLNGLVCRDQLVLLPLVESVKKEKTLHLTQYNCISVLNLFHRVSRVWRSKLYASATTYFYIRWSEKKSQIIESCMQGSRLEFF